MLPSSSRRKAGGPVVVALTAATAQTGLTLGELVGQCGVEPPAYGIIRTQVR